MNDSYLLHHFWVLKFRISPIKLLDFTMGTDIERGSTKIGVEIAYNSNLQILP